VKSNFEATWKRRFEGFALENDDDAGIAGWSTAGLHARLRNFLRYWRPLKPGALWLDAGCGAGTYSRVIVSANQRVVGLDYSLPSLRKARERSETAGIEWVAGDATKLPFPAASYDGAICFGVLQALSDPGPAISELARVVRPGGQVWVDALNASCAPNLFRLALTKTRERETRLRYDAPRRLRSAFVRGGFGRVRITWVPILPSSVQALQPVLESALVRTVLDWLPWLASALSHAFVVTAER
jgi:SAM-dependent methyltransferase